MAQVDETRVNAFYTEVGRRVRSARAGRGVSQSILARQIGFTRSSVANLEAGRQRIALHLFVQIAQALELEPWELLPEDPFAGGGAMLEELAEHLMNTPETTQEFVRGAVSQLITETER